MKASTEMAVIKSTITLLLSAGVVVIPILATVLRCLGCQDYEDRRVSIWKVWKLSWLLIMAASILLPDRRASTSAGLQKFQSFMQIDAIRGMYWLAIRIKAFHLGLDEVCKRYSNIASVLLISAKPLGEETSQDEVQMTDGQIASSLDTGSFLALSFFLTNLAVCILWYAFNYDPTASVNPAWTEVFG